MDETVTELKAEIAAKGELKRSCDLLEKRLAEKERELTAKTEHLEENLKTTEAIKEEAQQLLSKVSGQMANTEHLIDRRFISTFLFNYLNPKNSERLKRQMLESMVNVLSLSSDQRSALGLGPETGLLADFASFITKDD